MNWRERLADWITGGALTRARKETDTAMQRGCEWRNAWSIALGREQANAARNKSALARIAAMETPGANATVRRMAEAAREALK